MLDILMATTLVSLPVGVPVTDYIPTTEEQSEKKSFEIVKGYVSKAPRITVEWDGGIYLPADLPPPAYLGLKKLKANITFVKDAATEEGCQMGAVLACTFRDNNEVVMPNPCQYPAENYARLLCHELGHVRGWRHK